MGAWPVRRYVICVQVELEWHMNPSHALPLKGVKGGLETATSKSKRGGGSPPIAC